MELGLQAKLLRVLEGQEFVKTGDTKCTRVNVRLVAATNYDLRQEAEQGHFRPDLYYRLAVLPNQQDRQIRLMKNQLLPALRLTLTMLVLCCVLYPAVVWTAAQLAPGHGAGVQLRRNGRVVGFANVGQKSNVGQKFTQSEYFNSRSAAADYHADGSCGSNKGLSNPEYLAVVKARLDTFLLQNLGVRAADVPAELLTASGSGLDPHPSPQGALVQVARVAARRLPPPPRCKPWCSSTSKLACSAPTT
ncbi:potassium-transporting ATPase subunit C [uncultured Hymenobacter sp.]|uniref:potassium-transporting ATPase subunit C n=1 Tax=uncultured Hymenobacter sp. TaxID=170016 RepID=UPI0035CAC108